MSPVVGLTRTGRASNAGAKGTIEGRERWKRGWKGRAIKLSPFEASMLATLKKN
jgi:hypothetical protein